MSWQEAITRKMGYLTGCMVRSRGDIHDAAQRYRRVMGDGRVRALVPLTFAGGNLSKRLHCAYRDHVLQLLAIVIEPDACFPVASSSASASSSPRRFSSLALQILQTSLSTTGPARLLAALPQRTDAAFLPLSVERIPNLFDEADQEEYTAMMRAAARLGGGACEDVWGVAKGESRRDAQELQRKRRARENGARARGEGVERNVPENGWKVLELCATAWETEQEKMAEREPGLPREWLLSLHFED